MLTWHPPFPKRALVLTGLLLVCEVPVFAQRTVPPTSELAAERFAGLWIEADTDFPHDGLMIDSSGSQLRGKAFSCRTESPEGWVFGDYYLARSGTLLGDLCLGKMQPLVFEYRGDKIYVATVTLQVQIRGNILEIGFPNKKGRDWELTSNGNRLHPKWQSEPSPWHWGDYSYRDSLREKSSPDSSPAPVAELEPRYPLPHTDYVRSRSPQKWRMADFDALFGKGRPQPVKAIRAP